VIGSTPERCISFIEATMSALEVLVDAVCDAVEVRS
jgi:hypothetical protein